MTLGAVITGMALEILLDPEQYQDSAEEISCSFLAGKIYFRSVEVWSEETYEKFDHNTGSQWVYVDGIVSSAGYHRHPCQLTATCGGERES